MSAANAALGYWFPNLLYDLLFKFGTTEIPSFASDASKTVVKKTSSRFPKPGMTSGISSKNPLPRFAR